MALGIELALGGDIVIAADNCRFSQLEPKRGIHATGGATIRFVEATLTEQDMADLDAYYASQESTVESVTEDQMEDVLAGQAIYRGGYEKYGVPACIACHGPTGAGNAPAGYPALAGQRRIHGTHQGDGSTAQSTLSRGPAHRG